MIVKLTITSAFRGPAHSGVRAPLAAALRFRFRFSSIQFRSDTTVVWLVPYERPTAPAAAPDSPFARSRVPGVEP